MIVVFAASGLVRRRQILCWLSFLFYLSLKLSRFIALTNENLTDANTSPLYCIITDATTTTQIRRQSSRWWTYGDTGMINYAGLPKLGALSLSLAV